MPGKTRVGAGRYAFPQQSAPLSVGEQGIASLTHGGRTFRFRTNPNEFSWDYQLIKRVDQTYGGRVIQLLGCNIGDFSFKVETGGGRWPYMEDMVTFLKNIMIRQRNGIPATFEYTTRGWKLKCFVTSFPFQDQVNLASQEVVIQTKVQEDVSGLMSRISLSAELQRLKDGIGWERTKYNDPVILIDPAAPSIVETGREVVESGIAQLTSILGYTQNPLLPNSTQPPRGGTSYNEDLIKPGAPPPAR